MARYAAMPVEELMRERAWTREMLRKLRREYACQAAAVRLRHAAQGS